MNNFKDSNRLTELEIDCIAEKAADRAIEKVYERIGKSVAQKVFWFIGVAVIGMLLMIAKRDFNQ